MAALPPVCLRAVDPPVRDQAQRATASILTDSEVLNEAPFRRSARPCPRVLDAARLVSDTWRSARREREESAGGAWGGRALSGADDVSTIVLSMDDRDAK
jgi:hypothetical protein